MTRVLLVGTIVASLTPAAFAANKKGEPKAARAEASGFVAEAARFWDFACEVPKGWEVERSAYAGAASGAVEEHPLKAIKELDGGASAVLAVEMFRTGHPEYSSVDGLLSRLKAEKGTTVSAVQEAKIGKQSIAGRRFEATAAEAGLRTAYFAIPFGRKDGFRLLRYSAPVAEYERYLPAFERLLASFRYTGPRPKPQ
ncbi:MAG: hypothetical protein HY553_20045 [Elusimicrobia bacterium]|nr:hypothetical protein [Elusimicrobiota bacterium]